jgi:hypothetical protein
MIHFGLFIFLKVYAYFLLKSIQQDHATHLANLIEYGVPKEVLTEYITAMVEFDELFLHVALILFHMGLVAFDIVNLKEERLEDNHEDVKKCFKLRGFYFETVKLILFIVLAHSWHVHVPSAVREYDVLVYGLTCLIVGRIVNFIVSRKFQPMKNEVRLALDSTASMGRSILPNTFRQKKGKGFGGGGRGPAKKKINNKQRQE